MGKNQHSKDRLYVTRTEWKRDFGGKDGCAPGRSRASFRCLPFDHCALALTPFANPVATKDGIVFDIVNIVPYIKKHGKNPVTGGALSTKDLIRLNFHKNSNGKYHCPITFKVFNEHSHIVSISTSGNVFSYEAVQKLNVVPKCWVDQISGETFKKSDIITIQDPMDMSLRKVPDGLHDEKEVMSEAKKCEPEPEYDGTRLPKSKAKLKRKRKSDDADLAAKSHGAEDVVDVKEAPRKHHFTTGATSGSFTSTAVSLETKTQLAEYTDAEERATLYKALKASTNEVHRKAFVRLVTNLGNLNIQLECALAPATCHNFLLLCKRNYYDGVSFHRSIRKFMIQGGDPDGSGRGGQSAFGTPFQDECCPELRHDSRGVLSMANSGRDTNKSQFFILYGAAHHLDDKHTVFGRVVGGGDVLDQMENVPVSAHDRPRSVIRIEKTMIFSNPFAEVAKEIQERKNAEVKAEEDRRKKEAEDESTSYLQFSNAMVHQSSDVSVGKYLKQASGKKAAHVPATAEAYASSASVRKPMPPKASKYGDFSGW